MLPEVWLSFIFFFETYTLCECIYIRVVGWVSPFPLGQGGRKGEEGDVHFLGGVQNFLAIFRLCVCTCTAFCTPSEA